MWFGFGRKEGFPSQYTPYQSPVTVDVIEAGFIAAFLILAISFIVALPTTRTRTNVYVFLRVTALLVIGLLVLLGNFGQSWEVGEIVTKTPYKAGSSAEINATIGVFLGLRSVNVTLKSIGQPQELKNEVINYNERFSWTWDQGRFGFGHFAGPIQQQFRAAQHRGLPLPILWVVEHFVIDGEGFRLGRFYRTAGWYSHIAMYCAFTSWIIALILFKSVLRYGAYWLFTCGVFQLVANLLWLVIRNPLPLAISFEDAVIRTHFGLSFWLTFGCGLFCVTCSLAVILGEIYWDVELYDFFDIDPLNMYSEVAYLTKQEELLLRRKDASPGLRRRTEAMSLLEMNAGTSVQSDTDDDYVRVYRSRKLTGTKRSMRRPNRPLPSTSISSFKQ